MICEFCDGETVTKKVRRQHWLRLRPLLLQGCQWLMKSATEQAIVADFDEALGQHML